MTDQDVTELGITDVAADYLRRLTEAAADSPGRVVDQNVEPPTAVRRPQRPTHRSHEASVKPNHSRKENQ